MAKGGNTSQLYGDCFPKVLERRIADFHKRRSVWFD
jgi:hypothetical protein